ncbi:ABC transporter permease [Agrobacterium rubi]|uniref:ABC transporter permease n=1 Tax=Agrobacterium rubi TaxID=28099 RepID=UPI0015725305|nr:ABC transporter permease [Agrobacterium rubi]NTF10491.1 ABC transporter permease [Agrobacterium rubi]NTF22885.1 ABC transporter permease [Agrobacterium rubi]NTF29816.1 ABC transporter permease [Agrobacterium rubi]
MSGLDSIRSWRGFLLPALVLIGAEVNFAVNGIESASLAAPSQILSAGIKALVDGRILVATLQTIQSVLTGFLLGASLGVALGIILGLQKYINYTSEISVEAARAIPPLAVLPIWMIICGLGYQMEIAIIAFSTMWPNAVMARAAVANIEPRLLEVSRVIGLGPFARITKIALPAALPRIFVALRLSMGFSLIIAVTVEIIANPQGVGSAIMVAQEVGDPALMLVYLVWIGVIGFVLNIAMKWLETWAFQFHTAGS